MRLLIKSIRIIDPNSSQNGKTTDLLLENGKIVSIKKNQRTGKGTVIHDGTGQCVSPGWFDLHARFCDPGSEYKEDITSGTEAARQGGFTGVAMMPSTNPTVHTKSLVEYILNKSKGNVVDVFPVGAISKNMEGKELSESYDMFSSGAVAFSDDKKSVNDSGLMLRALLYTKNFQGLIMQFPDDKSISVKGNMNEGIASTNLGLKGIPAIAEEVAIARDLKLAQYAGTKIHFSTISTSGSVALIREAKKKGIKVTADIAAHQLAFTDDDLSSFDSDYKVMPPFRTKEDVDALFTGLADGTIDAICSDHTPEDVENKKKEFDYASFGIIGLETCFAAANTYGEKKKLSPETLVNVLAINPRKILNIAIPKIEEGEEGNLTLFDLKKEWTVTEKSLRSKSANSPFLGKTLKGKAVAVFNHGMFKEIK